MAEKRKRNKLSQRRSNRKKEEKQRLLEQRRKAWMLHQIIDEDLRNLQFNITNKKEVNNEEKNRTSS